MPKPLHIAVFDLGEKWSDANIAALKQLGHNVTALRLQQFTSYEQVLDQLKIIQPDFCFSRNFHLIHPSYVSKTTYHDFFRNNKYPFAIWYHDAVEVHASFELRKELETGANRDHLLFFTVDRTEIPFFESRKYKAEYLPLGVDTIISEFAKHPQFQPLLQQYKTDLSFVGTCPFETKENLKTPSERRNFFENVYIERAFKLLSEESAEINEPQRVQIKKAIHQFFHKELKTVSEYETAFKDLVIGLIQNLAQEIFKILSFDLPKIQTEYSWCQLTDQLKELREFDIQIFGMGGWNSFFPEVSPPIQALYREPDLIACYAASKISYCYTKFQFKSALHERPMMVLAAGGFPLTDYREDVEKLFSKDEIAVFKSFEEAKDLIRFYLKNDTERSKISERGRARVYAEHTYIHRMNDLVQKSVSHFNL